MLPLHPGPNSCLEAVILVTQRPCDQHLPTPPEVMELGCRSGASCSKPLTSPVSSLSCHSFLMALLLTTTRQRGQKGTYRP